MRRTTLAAAVACAALFAVAAAPAWAGANLVVIGTDPPGVGINDPTPVAPVGGNPGTTLGQQRAIAYQLAADIWGATLDSNATIFVAASFQPLACTPTSAVLGSAGTTFVFNNFPPGPPLVRPSTWYHSALADKIAGFDLNPGFFDIASRFNDSIDTDPNCLVGAFWYYGLDNNPPPGGTDFLNVVLHEFAHGLGFANFTNEASGAQLAGLDDIFSVFTFDNTQGKTWVQMNDAERQASAVNDGNVVWNGAEVSTRAADFLGPRPVVNVTTPPLGTFDAQAASFGPPLSSPGVTAGVVLADDGVGVGSDACEPLVNDLSGAIALIDRGACTFTSKVINAQLAGAVAAIVANNAPGGPAPMGGSDPNVAIPSVGITLAAGNAIKAALPGVVATVGLDPVLLAGADDNGLARLYAPSVVALGSSISHWDTSATPNLLMEPFITTTLQGATTLDLTPWQMADVGWMLNDSDGDGVADVEDACPASDLSPTVVIDGCDSGVGNPLFPDGCTISDLVSACAAAAGNHGQFVSCVSSLTNDLKSAGVISGEEKGAIQSCAAGSSLP